MYMTVIAVVIFVLACVDLAAFPAGDMIYTAEAWTVSRTISWNTSRPRICWIFAIANTPLRISSAMTAVWAAN